MPAQPVDLAKAVIAPVETAAEGHEASVWIKTLSAEKRAAIKELHKINPVWNLIFPLFAGMWVLAALVITKVDFWPVQLLCYATIGVVIHGGGNLMHEGIHGNLFRSKPLDRWLGFIAGAPALFSMTAYKVTHLIHHRYNRTDKDPDEITNLTKNRMILSIYFYVWFTVGIVLYLFHVPITALTRGTRREKLRVMAEYGLLAIVYAAIITSAIMFEFFETLIHIWFVPMIFAMLYGNIRGWAEHLMTTPGHPLTQTRTVTSNRVLSFFNLNLNYHIEHHLFPSVPWYNLPKVHALLKDDYRKAGSSVYKSYLRFVCDAFRVGVHGVTAGRFGI